MLALAAEPSRLSGVVRSTEPAVCAPIDANGNLTADGTKTYYWNALNQLVEVKEGSTTIATFEYDGAGRRTEKVAAGLTRTYIYDAKDIAEERITGSSSDTIRYYHGTGIDEPLARKNSSDVVTYYLADHLGSIVQESSAGGAVTLEREYDPWGVLTQGASTGGYAFTGREWDTEIALYYFRARYYSPTSGKWAGDDPIGLLGGVNLTGFVSNNPLRFVDPFGLCSSQDEEPQERNRIDRGYQALASRRQPTVLNEAIPEIAERARPMGEHDTYIQLTAAMLIAQYGAGGLFGFPTRIIAQEALNTAAANHPVAWEAVTDFVLSLAPTVPTGLVQNVSTYLQRSETFNSIAELVKSVVVK